jgi:uncharacterized protein (DUF433 family)
LAGHDLAEPVVGTVCGMDGVAMTVQKIQIIDHGRGPQLSTSRVTVQDLVPYFQEGCSYQEIIRWIPTLSVAEITVVEYYYREHQKELDDEDRLIRQRSAQNKNPAWVEKELEEARAERLAITERLRNQAKCG